MGQQKAPLHRSRAKQAQVAIVLVELTGGSGALTFALHLTRSQLRLRQQHQIVVAARLGVGTRHVEAAEGMHANKCARTFAVNVQVTAMNSLQRFCDAIFVGGEV